LDGQGGACLFAKSTKDAAGEIDPEKFGVPPAVFVFGGLKRDAADRACNGTQIAGDTPFFTVGTAGKDDAAPPPGRDASFFLGVKYRLPSPEGVEEDKPQCLENAQHRFS